MNCPVGSDELVELLRYPDAHYAEHLAAACSRIESETPAIAENLRKAGVVLAALATEQLEEQFTNAFDLNPVCCLEIGWHLFGENYDRGAFMARLRRELKDHGVPENGDLPDHLTLVLRLLARMEPAEAEDFYAACVAPALDKMRAAFRSQLSNAFAPVLIAICDWLQFHYGALLAGQPPAPVQLPV